jgi:DnaJ domain
MHPVLIFLVVVALLFVLALPYLASLSLYSLPFAMVWWVLNFPQGAPKPDDISDQERDLILRQAEEQKREAEQHIKSELRRGFSSNVRFIEHEDRFENRSNLGQQLNRSIQSAHAEIEELDSEIERLADPQLRRFLAWRNAYIAWRKLTANKTAVIGSLIGVILGAALLEFFDAIPATAFVPSFISPIIPYSALFGWVGGLGGLYIGRRRHASKAEAEIQNIEMRVDAEDSLAEDGSEDDWHEILGVPSDASTDDIHAAYKVAIRRCHPDMVANMSDNIRDAALNDTKRINDAYERARVIKGL